MSRGTACCARAACTNSYASPAGSANERSRSRSSSPAPRPTRSRSAESAPPHPRRSAMSVPTDPTVSTAVPGAVPAPRTETDLTAVRPFRVAIPEAEIGELRRRIAAVRWPSPELVDDRSQGVQLATMQQFARHWLTDYDMRRVEARLNAVPQFTTEIDGVDVHFLHVRSRHEDALPLVMTHGWPGSVVELLDSIGPLTDPTAHGGSAEDAFHLVLPSLPGYGFSSEPTEIGWDLGRTARAWAELMRR